MCVKLSVCYVTNVYMLDEKMIKILWTQRKFLFFFFSDEASSRWQRWKELEKSLSWLNICILSLTRVMCFNVLFNENKLSLANLLRLHDIIGCHSMAKSFSCWLLLLLLLLVFLLLSLPLCFYSPAVLDECFCRLKAHESETRKICLCIIIQ